MRHVEVVDEDCHGFPGRRTERAAHPFVDVTFDGALVGVNEQDKPLHCFIILSFLVSRDDIVTA